MAVQDELHAAHHLRARGSDKVEDRLQVGSTQGHVAQIVFEREHSHGILQQDVTGGERGADAAEIEDADIYLMLGELRDIHHHTVHPPVGEFALRRGGDHLAGRVGDDFLDPAHLGLHRDQVRRGRIGRTSLRESLPVGCDVEAVIHDPQRLDHFLGRGRGHAGPVTVHPILLPRVFILAGAGQQHTGCQRG